MIFKYLVDNVLKQAWALFCLQLNRFKYCYISVICLHTVCSIWPIDWTLSGATTLGQSGPGSNGNERVLHIPQIFKAGTLLSDDSMLYSGIIF